MNPQLEEYVRKAWEAGVPADQIRQNLIEGGWHESAVNEALGSSQTIASQGATMTSRGPVPLKSASKLIKEAWLVYKERWKTLLAISLMPLLFVVPIVVVSLIQKTPGGARAGGSAVASFFLVFIALFVIAGVIASIFAQIATIIALRDRGQAIGVKEAYRRSSGLFWGYVWVTILGILAIVGGFLLLIIPGIIVAVWLVFDYYPRIVEGEKGINALLKSKEYVKGRWWKALWRLMAMAVVAIPVVYLPVLVIGFIMTIGKVPQAAADAIGGILANVWGFVTGPFFAAYMFLMYENFRDSRGPLVTPLPGRGKMIGPAVWGAIATAVLIVGLIAANVVRPGI